MSWIRRSLKPMSEGHFSPVADFQPILDGLRAQGWVALPGFWPIDMVMALHHLCVRLVRQGALRPAAVGRGVHHQHDDRVRGDAIAWLDEWVNEPCVARYLETIDALRKALNAAAFLGLQEHEAHFAAYDPGAFYQRHLDRFRDNDQRTVSTVSYLNPYWRADDGGGLAIYDAPMAAFPAETVLPLAGTLVCFMSAEISHEVLPTTRNRYSIAGWLKTRSVDINH
jgi:SM-20-related protein